MIETGQWRPGWPAIGSPDWRTILWGRSPESCQPLHWLVFPWTDTADLEQHKRGKQTLKDQRPVQEMLDSHKETKVSCSAEQRAITRLSLCGLFCVWEEVYITAANTSTEFNSTGSPRSPTHTRSQHSRLLIPPPPLHICAQTHMHKHTHTHTHMHSVRMCACVCACVRAHCTHCAQ